MLIHWISTNARALSDELLSSIRTKDLVWCWIIWCFLSNVANISNSSKYLCSFPSFSVCCCFSSFSKMFGPKFMLASIFWYFPMFSLIFPISFFLDAQQYIPRNDICNIAVFGAYYFYTCSPFMFSLFRCVIWSEWKMHFEFVALLSSFYG